MSGLVSKVSKVFLTFLTSNACHLPATREPHSEGEGSGRVIVVRMDGIQEQEPRCLHTAERRKFNVSKVAIISLLEVHQIFFEGMGNNVGVVRIVLRV